MSLVENSHLSFLPLIVMSVLEEIQSSNNCMDTGRGQVLEWLEELLYMIPVCMNFILYSIIGSSRINDKIKFVKCLIQHLPLQEMFC